MDCETKGCGHPLSLHDPCTVKGCVCRAYQPADRKQRVALLTDYDPASPKALRAPTLAVARAADESHLALASARATLLGKKN